jgi:hypothetical protein
VTIYDHLVIVCVNHLERLCHRSLDSRSNTTAVNSLRPNPSDTYGYGFFFDAFGDHLTLPLRHLLAVTQPQAPSTSVKIVWQKNRSGHQRSGPAATTYLIDSHDTHV